MNVQLEWVLGAIILVLGTLFTLSLQNRARLNKHDIQLAKLDGINDKMDKLSNDFSRALEKHEVKEDRQFNELHHQMGRLVISVALLQKKSDPEDVNG